jgi:hypothetical protein
MGVTKLVDAIRVVTGMPSLRHRCSLCQLREFTFDIFYSITKTQTFKAWPTTRMTNPFGELGYM